MTTAYVISQLVNVALLLAFGSFLALRTRAELRRREARLVSPQPVGTERERQRRELVLKIESLQQELKSLDQSEASTAAFRASAK